MMAAGWRGGRGRRSGPADGLPQGGDTPRCFPRRGLRAKHGGRSARPRVGGNSCSLFSPLVCGDPGGDAVRRQSARSRPANSRTKDFSLLAHVCDTTRSKFICTSATLILCEDTFYPEARVCFTDFLLAAADQNLSLL